MFEHRIRQLVERGIIPDDSEIITQTNNLILRSRNSMTVARVSLPEMTTGRDDPQDISYSHHIAWAMSAEGHPVLQPLMPEPIELDDMTISLFPLANNVEWSAQQPADIARLMQDFSSFQSSALRTMDVPRYTAERLERVKHQAYRHNQKLYELIADLRQQQQMNYDLNKARKGTIHGDVHSANLVDDKGEIKFIDLDASARGPLPYDLSSWKLRQSLFDHHFDVDAIIEYARKSKDWEEEAYMALLGWKALSSLTYTLAYEKEDQIVDRANTIGRVAKKLGSLSWRVL